MPKTPPPLKQYLVTACKAADAAREITQRWFRKSFQIDTKFDQSPVTIADRETEQTIKEVIRTRHPDHSLLGEESGQYIQNTEWLWVIDPIDGTKSFATGKPSFGTLIALLYQGRPVLGIIDQSIMAERWIGLENQPTTYNGRTCHCRLELDITKASLCMTTIDMFSKDNWTQVGRLSQEVLFRVFGGDCYNYGLLALGQTHLVCEANLKPYDYLALIPVIEGAGGKITNWQGQALDLHSSGEVLASSNNKLHQQALALLK